MVSAVSVRNNYGVPAKSIFGHFLDTSEKAKY